MIHSFRGGDGRFPQSGLVINSAGALAGTTPSGGAHSLGVVFGMQPPAQPGGVWKFAVLHSFSGKGSDGESPATGLTLGQGNTLYGNTVGGGLYNFGVIFQLSSPGCCNWQETILYNFPGGLSGASPIAPMTLLNSALYGTTASGGNKGNQGIAFRVRP